MIIFEALVNVTARAWPPISRFFDRLSNATNIVVWWPGGLVDEVLGASWRVLSGAGWPIRSTFFDVFGDLRLVKSSRFRRGLIRQLWS